MERIGSAKIRFNSDAGHNAGGSSSMFLLVRLENKEEVVDYETGRDNNDVSEGSGWLFFLYLHRSPLLLFTPLSIPPKSH